MPFTKIKYSVLTLSSIAALSMGACSYEVAQNVTDRSAGTILLTSEALLAAPDTTITQDTAKASLSPEKAHMFARKQVNPDAIKGRLAYTTHPKLNEMNALSKTRLVKLDTNFKTHIAVDTLMLAELDTVPAPAHKPVSVRAKIPNTVQIAAAPAKPSGDKETLRVVDVRMGDYEDKTRLVLDLNAAAIFDYDINNHRSILTVHIDGAGWDLKDEQQFKDHALIKSYQIVHSDDDDTTLEFELKKPSRMLMSGKVHPDKKRGHRIFMDVAAL